jgi:hypothetical protein
MIRFLATFEGGEERGRIRNGGAGSAGYDWEFSDCGMRFENRCDGCRFLDKINYDGKQLFAELEEKVRVLIYVAIGVQSSRCARAPC